MKMLLLPRTGIWTGTGTGSLRCASWLLRFLLLLLLAGVCASSPARVRCPHLQCASEGRRFCKAGSAHCGSCLSPLVESVDGRCARQSHRHDDGAAAFPDLDEEIDYLRSVVEERQVTVARPQAPGEQVNSSSRSERIFLDAAAADQRSGGPAPTATPPQNSNTTAAPPAPQGSSTTGLSGRAGVAVGPAVGPARPPSPSDSLVIVLIGLCIVLGTTFMVIAAVCYFRLRKGSRLAQKVAYPAFRGPASQAAPPNGTSLGDKTLAQSAQMYHYQHHKQQMLSMGKHKAEMKVADSEVTSDEEEIGGDLTVYECPGLAPTGEMEVKNPLFDDSTLQYPGHQK